MKKEISQDFVAGTSLGMATVGCIILVVSTVADGYKSRHPKVDSATAIATMNYGVLLAIHGEPAYFTNKSTLDNFYEYCRREHGLARP